MHVCALSVHLKSIVPTENKSKVGTLTAFSHTTSYIQLPKKASNIAFASSCITAMEGVDTSLDTSNTSATVPQVNPSTQQSILIPAGPPHLGMYVATNYSFTHTSISNSTINQYLHVRMYTYMYA